MKVNYQTLFAVAAILPLCAAAARADGPLAVPADVGTAAPAPANSTSFALAPATSGSAAPPAAGKEGDVATYDDDSDPVRDFVARAGAWAVHQTGSPTKVDEYQAGTSSAFFNVEGIMSDGERTLDLDATGSDNDDQNVRLHYFGPHLEADLMWEQFPHQLDQSDFAGWNYLGQNNTVGPIVGTPPAQTPQNIVLYTRNNLAPNGQDYAIDVQEFKANFKGKLTENLEWRVNAFGMDKEGDRQVNAFQHCSGYQGNGSLAPDGLPLTTPGTNTTNLTNQCHVTSQVQHIDWETDEVTASLHLKMGCDTALEYQHLARQFTSNDQNVTYDYYAGVSSYSLNPGKNTTANALNTVAAYAIVPDTQTQIDRLKFTTKISENTDAYVLGYGGYNEDELRDMYRDFQGADVRITNKSIDTLTVTANGKYYHEDTTNPTFALSPSSAFPGGVPANNPYQEPSLAYFTSPTAANPNYIGPEINRQLTAFGLDGRWCPFEDSCSIFASRLAFVGGIEYSSLERQNANYVLASQPAGETGPFYTNGVFTQPDTDQATFTLGVEQRWSATFNTFLRYKYIDTHYPLEGVTNDVGYSLIYALNTNLPTQENRVELGGTWAPSDCLMVNATFYVENAYSNAFNNAPGFTPWNSNSLPFTFSTWWSPTCDWSFTFGAAEMDSWINQSVNLSNLNSASGPALSMPWRFTGTADVLTLGFRYRATCNLSFTGMFEYVRGMDENAATYNPASALPNGPPASWAYYGYPGTPVTVVNGQVVPNTSVSLGQYSLVKMNSYRLELGADYRVSANVNTYVRFDYYDYVDDTGLDSGQQNMFLVGASAKF